MTTLIIGSKITLSINGKERTYEVRAIGNGEYKLFNKSVLSFFATAEFIENHLVTN